MRPQNESSGHAGFDDLGQNWSNQSVHPRNLRLQSCGDGQGAVGMSIDW
jgi:hypothetical protein